MTVRGKLLLGFVALVVLIAVVVPSPPAKQGPTGADAATSDAPAQPSPVTATSTPSPPSPTPDPAATSTTVLGVLVRDPDAPAQTLPDLPADDLLPGTALVTYAGRWSGTLQVSDPSLGLVSCNLSSPATGYVLLSDVPTGPAQASRDQGGTTKIRTDGDHRTYTSDMPRLFFSAGIETDDGAYWSAMINTWKTPGDPALVLDWDGSTLRFAALVEVYRPRAGGITSDVAVSGVVACP